MAKTDQDKAKENLVKKANDTPSVQGSPSTDPKAGSDVLDALDKDPESNRAQAAEGDAAAQEAQADVPQVGSPIAPAPTEPTLSNTAEDADRGEEKPHPHLDNTDAEKKQAKVHPMGKTPKGMRKGADTSVPETDKSVERDDEFDLAGIRKALITARNKINTANESGVKLTREEFDDHLEVVQLAQEVTNLLGNLR